MIRRRESSLFYMRYAVLCAATAPKGMSCFCIQALLVRCAVLLGKAFVCVSVQPCESSVHCSYCVQVHVYVCDIFVSVVISLCHLAWLGQVDSE